MKKKTAIVTGGTHGIGKAIAEALIEDGLKTITISRHPENAPQGAIGVYADLTIRREAKLALREIWDEAALDVLVHCVGGGGRWGKMPPHAIENDQVWGDVMRKNMDVARYLIGEILPSMIYSKWGRVIFVSSLYGFEAGSGRPWFTMAKAAQIAYVAEMAKIKMYARNGITFNAVAPGPVMIEGTGWASLRDNDPLSFEITKDALPMGRLGQPKEVAEVVRWLSSEKSSWVNGATIPVDGGESQTLWRHR